MALAPTPTCAKGTAYSQTGTAAGAAQLRTLHIQLLVYVDTFSSSAFLDPRTQVYVRINFKMDTYRAGASFTVQSAEEHWQFLWSAEKHWQLH